MNATIRTSPPVPLPQTGDDLAAVRQALGLSLFDVKRAVALCREQPRFAQDFLLAIAWVDCDGLAVNVRGDRPGWNEATARGRVDALHARLSEAGCLPGSHDGAATPGP